MTVMSELELTLAEALRRMRAQLGWSQRVAADAIGCSAAFLCQLETGAVQNISLDAIQKITAAYKVNFLIWMTVKVLPRKNRDRVAP